VTTQQKFLVYRVAIYIDYVSNFKNEKKNTCCVLFELRNISLGMLDNFLYLKLLKIFVFI